MTSGGGWRDMDTAPRDGKRVRLSTTGDDSSDFVGYFDTAQNAWYGEQFFGSWVCYPLGWRPLGGTP